MIEAVLPAFLAADSTVFGLIGAADRERIFPLFIPQKQKITAQMPCIVYTVTSEQRQKTYCGTSPLVQVNLSLDLYALTILQARELSNAVRALLVDYRGLMGTLTVRDVSLDNSMTQYDMDPGLTRVIDMYSIWYQQEN